MPSTGERTDELVDAALQVRDDIALALAFLALGAQVEVEAFLLEAGRLDRVVIGELRGLARILGALEIALGDCALVPGPLRTLELALRGADLHVGEVGRFLGGKFLPADLDRLALERRVEALERRVLALEFVLEGRARERREHLARLDRVARAHRRS